MEVAFQEFRDCDIFRDSADQTEGVRISRLQDLLGIGEGIDKKRNRHENQQEAHQTKLHQHDLSQGGMIFTDSDNENAADQQLHPAGIRNLVGHLKRDDDAGERVDHRGKRIESEQIGKIVFPGYGKAASEQMRPEFGRSKAKPNGDGETYAEH